MEVIVLPVEEDDREAGELERLLLAAPTLSEDELQSFAQVRGIPAANEDKEDSAILQDWLQRGAAGQAESVALGDLKREMV